MILTIGGIKGGSGKTTLAVNVSVSRALKRQNVLLVDADEQKSASMWSQKRDTLELDMPITVVHLTGSSILSQVKKLAPNYHSVVIDAGGRNSSSLRAALLVSDIFLTPFRPRSLDIWTVQELEELLEEAQTMNPNLKAFSVLNQADYRGSDNKEANAILKESSFITPLPCFISHRKVFANAVSEGKGIFEYTPSDKKAEKELRNLISKLYQKNSVRGHGYK